MTSHRSRPVGIYPSAGKLVTLALLGFGMSALSAWFAYEPYGTMFLPETLYRWILAFGSVFFSVAGIHYLWDAVSGRPWLILDDDGLTVTLRRLGFFLWSEIERLERIPNRRRRARWLGIHVKDPEEYLSSRSPLKRAMLRMDRWWAGSETPILVPIGWPLGSYEQVARHIRPFLETEKPGSSPRGEETAERTPIVVKRRGRNEDPGA